MSKKTGFDIVRLLSVIASFVALCGLFLPVGAEAKASWKVQRIGEKASQAGEEAAQMAKIGRIAVAGSALAFEHTKDMAEAKIYVSANSSHVFAISNYYAGDDYRGIRLTAPADEVSNGTSLIEIARNVQHPSASRGSLSASDVSKYEATVRSDVHFFVDLDSANQSTIQNLDLRGPRHVQFVDRDGETWGAVTIGSQTYIQLSYDVVAAPGVPYAPAVFLAMRHLPFSGSHCVLGCDSRWGRIMAVAEHQAGSDASVLKVLNAVANETGGSILLRENISGVGTMDLTQPGSDPHEFDFDTVKKAWEATKELYGKGNHIRDIADEVEQSMAPPAPESTNVPTGSERDAV